MTPAEYLQAAYIKAIAAQVERDVKEKYVDGDTPAQQAIICEEVFFADREVTQTTLLEFIEILHQVMEKAEKRMKKYEFKKRGGLLLSAKLPDVKGDE